MTSRRFVVEVKWPKADEWAETYRTLSYERANKIYMMRSAASDGEEYRIIEYREAGE